MPNRGSQYDARELYAEYYGKKKSPDNYVVEIDDFAKSWVFLGYLTAVEYATDRFGKWERYRHEFLDGYYPLLHAEAYRRFLIPYANLDVTNEGIINSRDIPTKSLK